MCRSRYGKIRTKNMRIWKLLQLDKHSSNILELKKIYCKHEECDHNNNKYI